LEEKPDFIVSGINHGPNTAVSVLYSGTMGAAIEGCIHGIPSVGFSLCDYSPNADFSKAKLCVAKIFQQIATNGIIPGTCLNINIPKGESKGIMICRQTQGKWVEEFDKRTDPSQRDYYWLTGHFKNFEPTAMDTDAYAIENGYVAIVPVTIDMTAYHVMENLQSWNF
ncbi:MAG: 5'/3'-nucleotidase SurE, partial [Bacteroidota bacterium]|nr:5'/3'-nucleotidase SurE [Bacteroidota bacterium]